MNPIEKTTQETSIHQSSIIVCSGLSGLGLNPASTGHWVKGKLHYRANTHRQITTFTLTYGQIRVASPPKTPWTANKINSSRK